MQRLLGNRAGDLALAIVDLPERSPRVRPASGLDDVAASVDLAVARVRIGLQNAVVTPKVLVRMLALAVG